MINLEHCVIRSSISNNNLIIRCALACLMHQSDHPAKLRAKVSGSFDNSITTLVSNFVPKITHL